MIILLIVLLAFWFHVKYNEISQINLLLSCGTFLFPPPPPPPLEFIIQSYLIDAFQLPFL